MYAERVCNSTCVLGRLGSVFLTYFHLKNTNYFDVL